MEALSEYQKNEEKVKREREGKVHSIKCRNFKIAIKGAENFSMKKCFIKEEKQQRGKIRDLFRNLETSREISAQRLAK